MKPSTAKAKGALTESIFVRWLIEVWKLVNVERRHLNGSLDKGDIAGWVRQDGTYRVTVEVKSGAKLDVPKWLKELAEEKKNDNGDVGFVAVRPKGKPNVNDWYAIMPMPEFMVLMNQAGYVNG